MKLLNLKEAAQFLRMSRSTLYQRKDIPRYRLPGSRVMLFDQDELEARLKQGRVGSVSDKSGIVPELQAVHAESGAEVVDNPSEPVYHRNARYR